MTVILVATRNAHKVQEIRTILSGPCEFLSLKDFPQAPSVTEDAPDFAGNAKKKALALAQWLRQRDAADACVSGPQTFVLADDSGLEVDALSGAPGIHSARFAALDAAPADPAAAAPAAGNSPDAANNAKLLRLLADVPAEKRTARFRCVLAVVQVHPRLLALEARLFEGVCEGRIDFAPKGQGGFGYDPLFIPAGHHQSFAELGEAVKNRLSHRARALRRFKEWMG